MKFRTLILSMAGAAWIAGGAIAETVALQFTDAPLPISKKAPILHYRSLETTVDGGETLRALPRHLVAPRFGTLMLGKPDDATAIHIIVDEPAGQPPHLFVDANGNGDFSDDAPVTWEPFAYTLNSGAKQTEYRGTVKVQIRYSDAIGFAQIALDWLDPNDVRRRDGKAPLLYALNPSLRGTVALGGESYPAMLVDTNGLADYRVKPNANASGILLCLDINHNGQIDKWGEAYDVARPFTIKGVTYAIKNLAASGQTFEVEKSSQTVPEILPPPDLRPDQPILSFTATTIEDKKISFPADFKGKKILLAFWASWCGDCKEELPHLLAAYAKFRSQGLEVVGVSLDYPDSKAKLRAFMRANKITWPQIYEGKSWQGQIAQQYAMDWIPTLLLVDGDTGKILADNETLIGSQIEKTLQSKLGKK